jgi:hypothetical protein
MGSIADLFIIWGIQQHVKTLLLMLLVLARQ